MYSSETYEVIKQRILDNIELAVDKREGSVLSDFASANAMSLAKAYIDMDDILSLCFVDDTFDTFLDSRVHEFGIYRKEGTKAIGTVTVTSESEITINNGTIIYTEELEYVVLNDVTINGMGVLYVESLDIGAKYNILAGTILLPKEFIIGLNLMTNESAFTGGTDRESDEELRYRFNKLVSNPCTSGNKAHYESWALEVDGIGKAVVVPLWDGNGTIKIIVTSADETPVDDTVLTNVINHIEEIRPIGVDVTVVTPLEVALNISAKIQKKDNYLLEEVVNNITLNLKAYLSENAKEVIYSKVYGIVASEVGIVDFNGLVVNGGTANMSVMEEQVFVVGEVELIEVTL